MTGLDEYDALVPFDELPRVTGVPESLLWMLVDRRAIELVWRGRVACVPKAVARKLHAQWWASASKRPELTLEERRSPKGVAPAESLRGDPAPATKGESSGLRKKVPKRTGSNPCPELPAKTPRRPAPQRRPQVRPTRPEQPRPDDPGAAP